MIKVPDYNGGFVTKAVEGSCIVTRDNKGYLLSSQPINFIKKSLECKYGRVIEYSDNIVVLQKGTKTVKMNRRELNNYLHSFNDLPGPEKAQPIKLEGTFETEAGNVIVKGLDDKYRAILSDPDKIEIGKTKLLFTKSIGSRVYFAEAGREEKRFLLKSIDVSEKYKKILIKGVEATLKPPQVTTGNAWNKKGGQKPNHKYIERKPHPSGEGYIYLYQLPNGTGEWRDDNGKAIDVNAAEKQYTLEEFKKGDNVKMGDKIGRVEDASTNFIAVNFAGKVKVINKKEHIEKLKEHQLYKPGQTINTKNGEAKILQLTDNLALIKNIDNNALSVINLEKHITKLKKEDEGKLKGKLNKFNYVNEGYAESDYQHQYKKEDYVNTKEYAKFQDNANKAGLGNGDLERKKFVRVGNNIRTVKWQYDPNSKETIVFADGVKNHPLDFLGKRYTIKDIDESGYKLDSADEKDLTLSHKDYEEYARKENEDAVWQDAGDNTGGQLLSNPKKTYHFQFNTDEQLAQKRDEKKYKLRWKTREEKLQTPEEKARIEAERQQKLAGIKQALGSDAYRQFETQATERGFTIGENKFNASKTIEIEGNKFTVSSEFDPESGVRSGIEGKYQNLELGDNIYPITDLTKDRVFYNEQGTEKSISIDELKQINGKKVFEPTKESKGLISSNPATKFYFSPDEADAVSGFYEVIESKDLVASHNAGGEANPLYTIGDAQNRDRSKQQSKAQISKIATNPNFDLLADNRTVQDGAPVVNEDYNVIAGNGRALGIQEGYNLRNGHPYKKALIENAKRLGFDPNEIKSMHNPVLVRRVNVDNQEAQRLGAKSNESNMLKTEAREEAKGKATRIDDKTFNSIADTFKNAKGDYASLSDYLEDIGPDLVRTLSEKGIISDNEKHLFYDLESGKLNASHKEKLKDLLTQSILGDSSQHFENIPDAARQGITKGLGELFSIKGQQSDLVPHLQNAVKILAKYNTVKDKFSNPDDFIAQDANNMLDPLKGDKKDLAMFEALTSASPNEIKNKFRDYVNKLEGDMFEPPMNADEAFNAVFKPKYEKGINKSIWARLKVFGKKLLKSEQPNLFTGQTDEHGNQLLPSKKNPNVRRYQKNNQLEMEGLGAPKMKGADDYLKKKGKDEKDTPLFNQEEKDKNQLELDNDENEYHKNASIKEYGTKGIQIKTSDGQTLWIKGELYLDKAGGIDGKQKEILIKRELKNAYNNLLTKKENDDYDKAQGVNNTADLPGIDEIEKLIFTNNINKINEALKKLNEFVDNATDKHLIQVKKLDIEKLENRKKELQPFENYDEALDWIEKKEKEYGSKNKFFASDEYRKVYPKVQALHKKEKSKYQEKAEQALKEKGHKAGDEVEYIQADAWHNTVRFAGKIVMKDGIPYVNLNEKTVDGKKQIKWHKGFVKIQNKQYDIKDRNKLQAEILQEAGIPEEDIPDYVLDSVADGKILGKRAEAVIDGDISKDEAVQKVKEDYQKMKSGKKDTKFLEQEEKPKLLTEKQFYRKYYQHKIMFGNNAEQAIEGIKREGFKSHIGPNALPSSVMRGKPTDIIMKQYGHRAGDTMILVPKEWIKDTPNGPKIKEGFKPEDFEIVKVEKDHQDLYELYKEKYEGKKTPQTETEAFKNWFKDSKVVDESGKPLVVYHGTNFDFDEFDKNKMGYHDDGWFSRGFYFTNDIGYANAYTASYNNSGKKNPNIMPVYLSLQNPFVFSEKEMMKNIDKEYADGHKGLKTDMFWNKFNHMPGEDLRKFLQEKGYDGVIITLRDGKTKEFVAFEPEQIKSAIGNDGSFNKNNKSIIKGFRVFGK